MMTTPAEFAMALARRACDYARLAYVVHPGSLVEVSQGSVCPYGRYTVRRHYHRAAKSAVYLEVRPLLKPKSVALDIPAVIATPLPDWDWAFAEMVSPFWDEFLAGLARNGFERSAWGAAADRLADDEGVYGNPDSPAPSAYPTYFPEADAAGVSRADFVEAIRGLVRTAPVGRVTMCTNGLIWKNSRTQSAADIFPALRGKVKAANL